MFQGYLEPLSGAVRVSESLLLSGQRLKISLSRMKRVLLPPRPLPCPTWPVPPTWGFVLARVFFSSPAQEQVCLGSLSRPLDYSMSSPSCLLHLSPGLLPGKVLETGIPTPC